MPPRAPRKTPVRSDCDSLRELVSAYMPTLRFERGEASFPLRAESWLTHTTAADWPETAGLHGDDLPVDQRRRGTALAFANSDVESLDVQAGTPLFDRPLSLGTDISDPNAIGRFRTGTTDAFLVVGGWPEPGVRTKGDQPYLLQTFSEIGSAIEGATVPWEPVNVDAVTGRHMPTIWVAQPVTPTVYAEVEWAGMFPSWAFNGGLTDFAPDPGGGRLTSLDGFLSVTYYYLYGLRHPVDDDSAPTRQEGQWEAVSLFFRASGESGAGAEGRPRGLAVQETPEWVVISQNLVGGTHRVRSAPWSDVRKVRITAEGSVVDSTSCILYVGRGSHAFHFEPTEGHDWENEPAPGSDLDLDLDEDLFWQQFLWALLWLLLIVLAIIIAVLLATVLAVVIAVLVILVLLLLLILTLFALFSDHGSDTQPKPANEEASGNGPQGGATEPAADDPHGDAGDSGGGPAPEAGTPNAGSPTGKDTVAFDLRVVDMLNHANETTGFPPERKCEHPAWWDYTGAWGVRVRPSMASGWSNGMRRVDEQRRSWGYYAAAEVARRIDA